MSFVLCIPFRLWRTYIHSTHIRIVVIQKIIYIIMSNSFASIIIYKFMGNNILLRSFQQIIDCFPELFGIISIMLQIILNIQRFSITNLTIPSIPKIFTYFPNKLMFSLPTHTYILLTLIYCLSNISIDPRRFRVTQTNGLVRTDHR